MSSASVRAAGDAAFLAAVRALLEEAEAEVARLGFACRACGTCCDFARAGHLLFVTPGELALLRSGRPAASAASPPALARACPFHAQSKCAARTVRCLGCRLYFCDPAADGNFQRLYEEYHGRLAELHRRHGVPYEYGELTTSLEQMRDTEVQSRREEKDEK